MVLRPFPRARVLAFASVKCEDVKLTHSFPCQFLRGAVEISVMPLFKLDICDVSLVCMYGRMLSDIHVACDEDDGGMGKVVVGYPW